MEQSSNFHWDNLTWSDCMLFYKLVEALRWGTKCDTTVTQLLLPKLLFWTELTLQTFDLQELTRKIFWRFKTSPVHASNFFALIPALFPFCPPSWNKKNRSAKENGNSFGPLTISIPIGWTWLNASYVFDDEFTYGISRKKQHEQSILIERKNA